MTTLGVGCTEREKVTGWESLTPKRISAQEMAYRQLADIADDAWKRYILICDQLEDAKNSGDKVAVEFYITKLNQALDAAKDADIIKTRAYQYMNGGEK
jgi:hypothetical protein